MLSVTAALTRYAAGIVRLIRTTNQQLKAQRDVGSYRAQDVLRGFVQGNGGAHGVGTDGDLVARDLGTVFNVYLQIKLPLKATDQSESFHLHMQGYNYGASLAVDVTWAGTIDEGQVRQKDVRGSHTADIYIDPNGNVVLSCFFPNIYFTTVHVTAFSKSETKRIRRGQLKGTFSTTAQVTF